MFLNYLDGPLRIGWIGCGVMGQPMCRNLMLAGNCQVFVQSRTPSKCQPLVDLGATLCATPAEIIDHEVHVLISMVGTPNETQQIFYGDSSLLTAVSACRPRRLPIFIDMSTGMPALARSISEKFSHLGSLAYDAPVSGGDVGARNRKLTIFVGGADMPQLDIIKKQIFEKLTDVNAGGSIHYFGKAGSGHQAKLANQIMISSTMMGVCEGLIYARAHGLDEAKLLEAISGGAGGSWTLSNLGPRIIKRDFEPGFTVEHFIKDMKLALSPDFFGRLELPGTRLAYELYSALKTKDQQRLGTQALFLELEERNSRTLSKTTKKKSLESCH